MSLPALPATLADTGFDLSDVQKQSLTAAAKQIEANAAPLPDSVRQDTAGTVHLTWNQLGTRIDVTLTKGGGIDSRVTVQQADLTTLRGLFQFQKELQGFFVL